MEKMKRKDLDDGDSIRRIVHQDWWAAAAAAGRVLLSTKFSFPELMVSSYSCPQNLTKFNENFFWNFS